MGSFSGSKPTSAQSNKTSSRIATGLNTTLSSSFGSRPSSRNEDTIQEYRSLVQERLGRQILLICTDLTDKQRSKHVIDSAVALRNTGHKITIITTAFDPNLYSENLSKIGINTCGRLIPTSIYGYFPNLFYWFRSLYATIYAITCFRNMIPRVSVVFCETSSFMVTIIKLFTTYKVIYFQYQFELAQYRISSLDIQFNGFIFKRCLQKADKVLVPNEVFNQIYLRSFKMVYPTVCQPYLNVRQLKKEKLLPLNHILEDVSNDNLVFLILAEYHPRSNLELALDAFHLLLHTSEHVAHSRVKLVIAGHAGRGRTRYVRQLATRVKKLCLDSRVLLHPRPSRRHKKSLLEGCVALLSCQEHGLWDRYVLESMAMGKPVIAVNNGFTNEVLEHGVTGYLVPAYPDNFAAAMAEIIHNPGKGEFIGKMAQCEFIKTYSLEAYGSRLNQILLEVETKSFDSQSENGELFFG